MKVTTRKNLDAEAAVDAAVEVVALTTFGMWRIGKARIQRNIEFGRSVCECGQCRLDSIVDAMDQPYC